MALLLGSCYKRVCLLFHDLPSQNFSVDGDPLATRVLPSVLYLFRLRQVDAIHSLQYRINEVYIENLLSRVQLVTELVTECIYRVTEGTHSAQQAEAAFRSCRVLETDEDVRNRTMAHPAVGVVCSQDPVLHAELPTFVWRTPETDRAFSQLAAATGVFQTADDWSRQLYYDHIGMYSAAIAHQQQTIRRLVEALSQQAVLTQLTEILTYYMVPKWEVTKICAKIAAQGCLWTEEVPTKWLTTPATAIHRGGCDNSRAEHPSCVVVEEVTVVAKEPAVCMKEPTLAVQEPAVVVEEAVEVIEEADVVGQEPTEGLKESAEVAEEADVVLVEDDVVIQETPVLRDSNCSPTVVGGNKNSSSGRSKGRLLFIRIGKVVAAAGVSVACMLAGAHGARVIVGRRLR